MTPGWFLATSGHRALCGYGDGHICDPDTPMRVIAGKVVRCYQHTSQPVDWEAVQATINEREARQSGQDVPSLRGGFTQAAPGSLNHLLKHTAGIVGVRRSRQPQPPPPKPFHEVADDPVIARLCAEDNQ